MTPLIALLAAAAAAAPAAPQPTRRVQYVMGTLCDVSAYGTQAPAAITAAFAEIEKMDRELSLYKKESELNRLNAAAETWFPASDDLWEEVTESLKYAKASGGAFDPTILPVLREGPRALSRVGYAKIELDPARKAVRLPRGAALDFGGIGKGIALDHAARILRERGVVSALLNFGGQIYALGTPPGDSGWTVRVQGSSVTLRVHDASVSTSGNAEKPGHIASPFTGGRIMAPYSVTVVAPTAAEADGWDTPLFVLGPDRAADVYGGCFLFSGARPVRAPACSRYLEHD